jgi:predicted helicase
VYGLLHSPEYKQRFEADLKKMLPRIPYAQDFWGFSNAGKELAHWHLNYETIDPYPVTETIDRPDIDPKTLYRVEKMAFTKTGKQVDKTLIRYNSHITLSDIPLEAYEYKVCDRSALDWVMERYAFTTDKDSGITNNPNDWSDDPRYIIDLVKRIVRVSMETVRIVNSLPALNELTGTEKAMAV